MRHSRLRSSRSDCYNVRADWPRERATGARERILRGRRLSVQPAAPPCTDDPPSSSSGRLITRCRGKRPFSDIQSISSPRQLSAESGRPSVCGEHLVGDRREVSVLHVKVAGEPGIFLDVVEVAAWSRRAFVRGRLGRAESGNRAHERLQPQSDKCELSSDWASRRNLFRTAPTNQWEECRLERNDAAHRSLWAAMAFCYGASFSRVL